MPMQMVHGKSCKLAHSVSLQQVRISHEFAGMSLMALKPDAILRSSMLLFSLQLPANLMALSFSTFSESGASAALHYVSPGASTTPCAHSEMICMDQSTSVPLCS